MYSTHNIPRLCWLCYRSHISLQYCELLRTADWLLLLHMPAKWTLSITVQRQLQKIQRAVGQWKAELKNVIEVCGQRPGNACIQFPFVCVCVCVCAVCVQCVRCLCVQPGWVCLCRTRCAVYRVCYVPCAVCRVLCCVLFVVVVVVVVYVCVGAWCKQVKYEILNCNKEMVLFLSSCLQQQ